MQEKRANSNVFGISGTELFFIGVFALVIFGPDKLPALGRTVGRFMREFKRAQENVETLLRAEMYAADGEDADAKSLETVAPVEPAIPAYGDDADEEEEDEE